MKFPFRRGARGSSVPGASSSRGEGNRGNLPVFLAGATLAMLLAMTIGTAFVVRSVIEQQSADRFDAFVAQSSNSVAAEIRATIAEVGTVEGLFVGSDHVTLPGFSEFAGDLRDNGLSARSVQFLPRVVADEAEAFERAIQEQGLPGFQLDVSEDQAEYFPVVFIDPLGPSRSALGWDMSREPAFRNAMEAATRSGRPVASAPAALPGTRGPEAAFGVFAPIYRAGGPVRTAEQRQAALLGYGVTFYYVSDFLAGPLARAGFEDITVSAHDVGTAATASEPVAILFPSSRPGSAGSRSAATLDVAGRAWRFDFITGPWYGISSLERNVWLIVLAAGLAITLIATGSSYSLVSSQQSAQSNLKLMSAQLSVFLDSALEGILLVDRERQVVWANQAFANAFGYPDAHALQGRVSPDLEQQANATLEDASGFAERLREIYADEELKVPAEDIDLFASASVTYSRTSVPVTDEAGNYRGRLWVYRDVTAERVAEQAKGAFVSMVSHELRTPLTSVIGFLELVLSGAAGPVTTEASRLLSMARRSGERLRRLVNDILDVSRLEGGIRVELAPTHLAPIVVELIDNIRREFEARKLSLRVDVPIDLPLVLADSTRLFQVLTNLLTNAYRYTPEGGKVTLTGRERDGMIEISVADTGVGIPPEDRERVFGRFVRVNSGQPRPAGSTGLGLAIARSLTELQGGTIEVDSEIGAGSRFVVRLPKVAGQSESPAAA